MKSFQDSQEKPIYSYNSGVFAFVSIIYCRFLIMGTSHVCNRNVIYRKKQYFMVGTLAAVPASAMHVFNFVATMWNGRIKFSTPMMWAVGGIALFFSAGAGGVANAAMPLDFTTHDTYWVVGHFHLFVMGTIAFGSIGFLYYMFPYVTGRMYNETMGKSSLYHVLCWYSSSILYTTRTWLVWNAKKNFRLSTNPRMDCYEPDCNSWCYGYWSQYGYLLSKHDLQFRKGTTCKYRRPIRSRWQVLLSI